MLLITFNKAFCLNAGNRTTKERERERLKSEESEEKKMLVGRN